MSKTFTAAYHYSQPDVLVFLGDLMDEGSKATTAEYAHTLDRFNKIFSHIRFKKVKYICMFRKGKLQIKIDLYKFIHMFMHKFHTTLYNLFSILKSSAEY